MRIPPHVLTLIRWCAIGLGLLSLFRIALLMLHRDQWSTAPVGDVLRALFNRGWLFDLYVLSWSLAVPALLFVAAFLAGRHAPWIRGTARGWFTAALVLVLLMACADIPFYGYLNMRLTKVVFHWTGTPMLMLKEFLSTPSYLLALAVFIASSIFTARIVRGAAPPDRPFERLSWGGRIGWSLMPLLALFLGIRGTWDLDDEPLNLKDAYFCETPFLNQLGPNAPFTLADSYANGSPDLMPAAAALANVQRYLGIIDERYTSPIARDVGYGTQPDRRNVVLILVESLSANRLKRFGHPKDLMPFLGSLMDSSMVYDHFYSSGTRTCNGIFSSLYGLPAVFEEHPFAHPSMTAQRFHGLPQVLKANGYRTAFYYPGDPAFDNMRGFLPNNGFDALFGQEDYPGGLYRNSWGVTDHTLFQQTLRLLDEQAEDPRPFLATIMTISSHVGYNVPDDIPDLRARSDRDDENIYEYTDAALAAFFAEARQRPWYANTLFVLTGDHGQRFDPVYEVPLSYHHVPLVIFDPRDRTGQTHHGYGTQVDLPETILGLLRLPHVNNTLGSDLRRWSHPCAYFCSDSRIAALNDRYYWIRSGDVEHLYDLASGATKDVSAALPAVSDSLRTYAESMTAVMRHMVKERLVGESVPR